MEQIDRSPNGLEAAVSLGCQGTVARMLAPYRSVLAEAQLLRIHGSTWCLFH